MEAEALLVVVDLDLDVMDDRPEGGKLWSIDLAITTLSESGQRERHPTFRLPPAMATELLHALGQAFRRVETQSYGPTDPLQ